MKKAKINQLELAILSELDGFLKYGLDKEGRHLKEVLEGALEV